MGSFGGVGSVGGVGSAGGSGVVGVGGTLAPSFSIPDFRAAIIASLIDIGGERVLVGSVVWLLVGGGVVVVVAAGVVVVGIGFAGVLVVVGVAGAAAGLGEPGAKKCSVVLPWCSSKWSRAHCLRCLSVKTAVPVRALGLGLHFFLPQGGGGGIALKRALCASRTRCRRYFLADGEATRAFGLGAGGGHLVQWLVIVFPGRRGLMVTVTSAWELLPGLRRR